ncbi:unnamed protein product [Chironomus riparius]|uniref:Cuticle protein n=1 Tax=Chironomus riparius TaxID=315576 RepID=A0A9N9RM14_9DIPT|nr:unnamed protein product [Chironomus riparius]
MKSIVILFAVFACTLAAPQVSVVATSPLVSAPLLTKVEGEAPASTVHAVHTKVVPQVIAYSVPAPIVHHAAPIVSAPVISAYSAFPVAPFAHHSAYRIVY